VAVSRCWAVVPAAGVGERMRASVPKQYLPLAGRRIIEHTLDVLLRHPLVDGVVVALSREDDWWPSVQLESRKPLRTVIGGPARCDSVRSALRSLRQRLLADDWVLVHDAARPCLSMEDLNRLIQVLIDDPVGGLLAVPVRDTMKRADPRGRVRRTEDRTDLWHALTPQMFRFGVLWSALQRAMARGVPVTDESMAVELAGLEPRLVRGRADNIKITRPEDLALAEAYLSPPRR
jgi:2-C-methyl-D-erythritol 4-phosphate cytidylyltransferase